jgi:hypothetical protein
MKNHRIISIITFLIALYLWSYDNWLYETTYFDHLPNPYQNYTPEELANGKGNHSTYVPWYGLVLYYLTSLLSLTVLPAYLLVIISSVVLFFFKKKYFDFEWIFTQVGIIIIIGYLLEQFFLAGWD